MLRAFVAVLPYFPGWFVLFYTRLLTRTTFFLCASYRKRMEENLAAALGHETSAQERNAMVWAAWTSFARSLLDTSRIMHYSKECIRSTVNLEGEEHIRRALQHGKGVLALSAHLGNFTLIGVRLAAAGFSFSVVVKQPADERFARLIDGYRAQSGIHTISAKPRREAVRGILKALRSNHIVLVIADEFKSGDVMVDFLGLRVPAPRGPATLALRTGAVTLPMFVTRQPDDSLRLSVEAPIAPIERGDVEASIVATTEAYTRHLEAAVRKAPEQWNWLGLPRRDSMSRAEIARKRKALGLKRGRATGRRRAVRSDTPLS
jgi:KDO2-lipid IV(A) lauroyltransferase